MRVEIVVKHRLSRRAVLTPLLGLAAAPLGAQCTSAQARADPPVFRTTRSQFALVQPARSLPPVTLTDLAGRAARVAAPPGKVLLVNIWATWCAACLIDLPLLERFHNAVAGRVSVAAVSIDRTDRDRVKAYLERIAVRNLPIYLDPDGRLASTSPERPAPLPPFGMPITYLVTPSGQVAGYISGVADWLSEDAQRLIAYYGAA